MNFNELNISENTKRIVASKGFTAPTEVQEKVIPAALLGQDLVAKSKTGTGKTAAFAIPLVEMVKPGQVFSALVIVPTRELALQVKKEIESFAVGFRLRTVAIFGGDSVSKQLNLIRARPEIIVGTPGRLLDFISRKELYFNRSKILVLDEADRMFDMGFRDDIEKIISLFSKERQTMLFAATMPQDVHEMIKKHLSNNRVFFNLSQDESPVDEVSQYYLMVDKNRKVSTLQGLINQNGNGKTLVFCRTKRTVDWLEAQLSRRGVRALAMHGGMRQGARNYLLENFKRSRNGVLIATDLVARGIHVEDISHVINFDFPDQAETYIHRIGRTARQGRKGTAISFCTNVMELENLERIGAEKNTEITEMR